MINTADFYKDDNRDIEYIHKECFPLYRFPDDNVKQYIYTQAYGQPLSKLVDEYKVKIKEYQLLYQANGFPMEFNSVREFNNWLKENNFAILPNGSIYDQGKPNAIISKVIADIMDKRTEYKNMMKDSLKKSNEAKAEGNKELSKQYKEESEVHDMNQKAVKVINNSCFVGDTLVMTDDFGMKKIKDIKVGDKVLTYNLDENDYEIKEVTWSGETKRVRWILKIETDYFNDDIYCTHDHKFWSCIHHQFINAEHLNIGDILLTDEGNCFVENIELVDLHVEVPVYDITVEDNHNFFANGVLVHNCYGVTASEQFRLFNINIAEGITTTGQSVIRNSRYIANRKLNSMIGSIDEDYIVTIDTDSLIFTMDKLVKYPVTERRKAKLQEISEIPTIIQKEVNTNIVQVARDIMHKTNINESNNYLNIKNEWVADSGLFLAKKRYAIHQVFKEVM